MLPYQSALAALRDGRYYAKQAERPVALRTDSGVYLEIPGPAVLADVFALPWLLAGEREHYRSGAALLVRPRGSQDEPRPVDQRDLTPLLLRALKALPDLSSAEAGRPYRDLRRYLTEASPAARDGYLAKVISHTRRLLPEWRPPKAPKAPSGPARSAAERKAASRERARSDEEASAREWLEGFLSGWDGGEERPAPGSRWLAAELYDTAAEAIGDYAEDGEEREDGGAYRVPRQRVFYSVADELLGPRRRGAKGSAMAYTIPGA